MKNAARTGIALWLGLVACGPELHSDDVRLTDRWLASRSETEASLPRARVANATRIGIPIPADSIVRVPITIPPNAELRAHAGLVDASTPTRVRDLEISVCDSPESRSVVGEVELSARQWKPIRIDLEAWANERTGLCFATKGGDAGEAWLANASVSEPGVAHAPLLQSNLLLVTRSHGGERAMPPDAANLTRLAAEGERFPNALANSPRARPAHASLLTGLHPREYRRPGEEGLVEEVLTLAERFWALGHRTGAFVSDPALTAEWGLAQGFDIYDEAAESTEKASVNERALAWLDEQPGSFFLFVNHDERDTRSFDRSLGELFDGLRKRGVYQQTIVAVVSNRGEASTPGGAVDPIAALGVRALRSPIVIKYAEHRQQGRRGKRFVRRTDPLDLHASVLREVGLMRERGRNRIEVGDRAPDRGIYGLHEDRPYYFAEIGEGNENIEAVFHQHWELLRDDAGNRFLIDLRTNPDDTQNLADLRLGTVAHLSRALDAWPDSQALSAPRGGPGHYSSELVALMHQRAPQRPR